MVFLVRWVSSDGYALNEYRHGAVRTVDFFNSRAQANIRKKEILRQRQVAMYGD